MDIMARSVNLMLLPTELWTLIFRWASGPPGAFDAYALPPCGDEPRSWTMPRFRGLLPPYYRVLTNIVLVSKLFYSMSIDLLYGRIVVTSEVEQLHKVLHTLRASQMGSRHRPAGFVSRPQLGMFTKRLDIEFSLGL
jgi:hypothetical protein